MSGKSKDRIFFDDDERVLIESAESHFDAPSFRPPSDEDRLKMNAEWQARISAGDERKPVTLRLQQRDIERLKIIARKKGMPYQTLVASVLHQFVAGDLIER